MSQGGFAAPATKASVAVAVHGDSDSGGKGSRRAVTWAIENLLHEADRFVLVHVMPKIASIPTPCIFPFPYLLLYLMNSLPFSLKFDNFSNFLLVLLNYVKLRLSNRLNQLIKIFKTIWLLECFSISIFVLNFFFKNFIQFLVCLKNSQPQVGLF